MAATREASTPSKAAAKQPATTAVGAPNKSKPVPGAPKAPAANSATARTTTSIRTTPATASTAKPPAAKSTAAKPTTPATLTAKAPVTKPAAKAPSTPATTAKAPIKSTNPTSTTVTKTAAKPTASVSATAKPNGTTAKPVSPSRTTTVASNAKPAVGAGAKKPLTSNAASSSAPSKTPASTTANAAASRRVPATATARTTTSIRVPPGSAGQATKPPAVGGRPPVNMTPTTIRSPARTPSTVTTPAAQVKKTASTSASRPGTATPTATRTRNSAVAPTTPLAKRASMSSNASTAQSASSTSSSARPIRTTTAPVAPSSLMELKKAIASVQAKLEETSGRLQAKDDELVSLRRLLEIDTFADSASSDGGETLVPEIDLSKLAAQDKDVVVSAIAAKEKEVARKKHQVRTLRGRTERMRFEHELKAQELIKKGAENKAANDAELASLQQQLVAAVEKHNDVIVLREKLEETKALHATTIEELNRIHDDKLQSLESELQMAKQQRLRGSNLSGHVQDLEEIMETHEQELTRLLKEHQQEIDAVNADFDNQKKQEVEEYETEVKERLDSELEQIKASQASLLNDRLGTESNMSEVLQERHDRAWEDLKVKTAKEHAHYLSAVQNKHQSELSRLEVKHAASTTELEKKVAKLQQKYDTDMMSIRSKADTSVEELKNKHENEIKACAEKHAAELVAMELSTKDNMQSELDAVQKNFASFVADIQGTQDNAMRSLENGYETRIAELIVGHENRVRELENEANEQVQQELERVEMEFEIDRERLAEEQAKKIAELKAAHEVTLEQLEDQLTKAEDRAKELIATIKRTRQTHEMEMSEVKADLEAQLSAVEISIEALVISKQQDDKGRAETLEAGHATVISAKKSVHEMNLNEALTMKETAWRTKTEPLLREIEIMRERLQDTQSERDKAQSAMKAMEIRLKEEYGAALEGLNRDHSSRVEQRQQAAHARADRLMKPHSDNADVHESKLADLLTSHHQKLQTMNDQHQAVLKVQEQTNQGRVKALQQSIEALSIKAGGSETMVSLQKLAELKKQNELLKGENQQLESMVKQLQGSMTTIA